MTPSDPVQPNPSTADTIARPVETIDAAVVEADNGPHWLHPSSLLFEFTSGIRKQLIPAIIAVYSAAQWGLYGLILASIFFAITMGIAIFRYVTVRYQVRGNDFILDDGFFFRRHRTIPVQRIQNIDLTQSILHRLLRVAEVRIETASGKEPEAKLRVLSLNRIDDLRARVFHGHELRQPTAATISSSEQNADESFVSRPIEPPTQRLLTIPSGLLVKAGFLSNRGMVLVAVAFGAIFQFTPWSNSWDIDPKAIIRFIPVDTIEGHWVLTTLAIIGILLILRLFSVAWYILRFHGYILERRGEELRIHCGLFSRVSATIPRRRIQLISIQRTVLGKALGIASIRIETAGGSGSEKENAASTIGRRWFIPVLRECDVARLMPELRPGIQWDEKSMAWQPPSRRAAMRMRRLAILIGLALTGLMVWYLSWPGAIAGVSFCILSWWYAGKKASVMRYARGDFGLAYRSGMLTKKCSLTFLEKVQSVWVDESPFDRRWKMATLCVDTAGAGPADHKFHVRMLEVGFARDEVHAIARQASKLVTVFR